MSIFAELQRRNVVRMAVLYVVITWLLLQVADVLFDQLGVPPWAFRMVFGLLVLGLPIVLIFSWLFELTPEGLKRERDVERGESIVNETGHKMNTTIVVLLVLAIGGLIADRLIPRADPAINDQQTSTQAAALESEGAALADAEYDATTIAVLPFVNMSGDAENEYFSDGLSEELLNSLVRLGGLKVTGRTSSFAFRGQNQDLREIGRLLSVANVLEGSVRKAGNRVRITAQLVKTSDGYHLWSDTFDRELDDIFAIQAEIADRVTEALQVTLMGQEQADVPVTTSASHNAQAYEEYLRGMYVLRQNPDDEQGLEKAQNYFAAALAIDPDYLDAHWGMFSVWDRINRNGYGSYEHSAEQQLFYAAELRRLAPGSEESLNANARAATFQGDTARAFALREEAVQRFPESAASLAHYGLQLSIRGDYEEARKAAQKALQLDPLSLEYLVILARINYNAKECPGVQDTLKRAFELDPAASRFRYLLAICLYETGGDLQFAVSLAEEEPLVFMHDTALAIFHNKLGNQQVAQQHLDHQMEVYQDSAAYQYSQVYAQWGDIEKALDWLERAVEVHDPGMLNARIDPLLNPLRDEPRFQKVLQTAYYRQD